MRIQLVTPFKMQWIGAFKKRFESIGWEVDVQDRPAMMPKPDVQLLMWLSRDTVEYLNSGYKNGIKTIVWIRRYEFYTDAVEQTNWNAVDAVVMVNDFLAHGFNHRTGIKPYVIWNGVEPNDWKFKEHRHGDKIASVGFVNMRKNLPLALQILCKLPKNYELHVAGEFQDGALVDYISNFCFMNNLTDQVFMYGQVENIDLWLEDKNYLLCTAISEGCPNNVLEAMAKGIKPVVHNWPGSGGFKPFLFNTVDEAVEMIDPSSQYDSGFYRNMIVNMFGKNVYDAVIDLIQKTMRAGS